MGFIKEATRRFEGENRDRAYLCPSPFTKSGDFREEISDELNEWSKGIVSDGLAYLRGQPAFEFIQEGYDLVNGLREPGRVPTLSDAKTDMTLRNLQEIVAAQTNIRIIPAFKTEIPEFRKQNGILNKRFMLWQGNTFADRGLRKSWQYANACGTGYAGLRYDPNFYYKGRGDIVTDSYGPLDVLPVGMSRQHNLQDSYAVAIKVATPIHKAWRLFPLQLDKLHPMRNSRKDRGTVTAAAVKYATAVLRKYGPGAKLEEEAMPWEEINIYYIYVDDDSVNNTGQPIPMMGPDGIAGCSWCYTVPYIGQRIAGGREATREDCLMYPNRRLICATEDGVLNPYPLSQASYWWHGKVPVVPLRVDDWAWTYLGFPVTRMGLNLEKAGNDILKGIVDSVNNRLNPSRFFNRNSSAAALMQGFNPRVPGQAIGMDMDLINPDTILKTALPVNFYEFPQYIPEIQKELIARATHQMGVNDISALARARQIPSGDSQQKLMEMMGPLTEDRSRNMEMSIRDFGEMWKSMEFQFTSASKRYQMLGPDGLADEDTDQDPGTLIPFRELEIPEGFNRILSVPQFERARWHSGNFMFSVIPYSIHEINSMTKKLGYLQLKLRGFPLDPWTEAEMWGIENFGDIPKIKDPRTGEERAALTILERWTVWMEIQARMQMALSGGGQGGKHGQGGGHKGRPPSGGTAPTLEQKSSGAGTIRESKR